MLQSFLRATLSGVGGADASFQQMLLQEATDLPQGAAAGSHTAGGQGAGKAARATEPKSLVERVLASQRLIAPCECFVLMNDTKKVQNHPAFGKFLNMLKNDVLECTCDSWDSSICEFRGTCERTIADFIWGIGNGLRQEDTVPYAVPMLAAGALVRLESECESYMERRHKAAEAGEDFTVKDACAHEHS